MKLLILASLAASFAAGQPVLIRASLVIDGRGGALRDQQIEVNGGRIQSVRPASGKATYDLAGLTLMPGWIDTHVHPAWFFDTNNRLASSRSKPEVISANLAANLWATLQAGFTTVQS